MKKNQIFVKIDDFFAPMLENLRPSVKLIKN